MKEFRFPFLLISIPHVFCWMAEIKLKRAMKMEEYNFVKNTLDQIPQAYRRTCKKGGRITGYKLPDETFVSKPEAVSMAKQGQTSGMGIAHRGDTECLKSIPDGRETNNLGNLPSVPPKKQA